MVAVSAAASVTKESNSNSNLIEDDATKRNTDCVYFLASPLTCKKGSECEYRHSEYARMNPRDCYYWLNGSCLNLKCAFRHPPLDSLLGTQQSAASNGAALPHAKAPPQVAVSQSKQVPCIFFQKGLCYKGDICAFLHGPVPVATKTPQVTSQAAEVTGLKTIFGEPQQSYQPKISKSLNSNGSNSILKVFNGLSKAKTVAERFVSQPVVFNGGSASYSYTDTVPLSKTDTILVSNHMRELEVPNGHEMHNGKDAEDLYRESSPGFDVLVDDELAEGEYYDDVQYGTTGGGLDGGNVNEYGAVLAADSKMFHDPQRYDGFDRMPGQYYNNQSKRSSERISRGSASIETRNNPRRSNSDRIDHSDLRYRLEQKKGSDLRPVICNDYTRDNRERRSTDYQRDSRIVSPLESSLNTRPQNRMRDTRRSPMRNSVSDIDNDNKRNLSRTSPGRRQIRDRIGTRVHDDLTNDRTSKGYETVKEGLEDGCGDFSGPKRLSELKNKVSVKNRLMSEKESFSLGKRKINDEHEQLDSNISFEGPKPLSEILKRKKMSKMNAEGSESLENKESDVTVSLTTGISQDEPKSATDVSDKKTKPKETQLSEVPNTDKVDHEEGMENQNMEACDDGEEYYYEEDGGEYYYEEGENAEGEYVEEVIGDSKKETGDMQS